MAHGKLSTFISTEMSKGCKYKMGFKKENQNPKSSNIFLFHYYNKHFIRLSIYFSLFCTLRFSLSNPTLLILLPWCVML